MAEYLASIFGTEKDKVNCSFYFKIGSCRHGDKCSRVHNKPTFSQTLLLQNLYHNPLYFPAGADLTGSQQCSTMTDAEAQEHFDDFFEEIFVELEDKYGELEEINVCDNISEHLIGNTYVKFRYEKCAGKAVTDLNRRWFDRRPINAELSPVTDFREACCRQYEMGECTRGGFCNFMHLRPISRELKRKLYIRDHPWRKKQKIRLNKRERSHNSNRRSSSTHTGHFRRSQGPDSCSGSPWSRSHSYQSQSPHPGSRSCSSDNSITNRFVDKNKVTRLNSSAAVSLRSSRSSSSQSKAASGSSYNHSLGKRRKRKSFWKRFRDLTPSTDSDSDR